MWIPPVPFAPATTAPPDYSSIPNLALGRGSIDTAYAAKFKKNANAPGTSVSDLQRDLIALGYLEPKAEDGSYGAGTESAVRHFQRHAGRAFRLKGANMWPVARWVGAVTGICDQATAKEVRHWIDKAYRLPLGLYKIIEIEGGRMRNDVAALWAKAIADVVAKGGFIVPPGAKKSEHYSDTWRNPANGFKHTGGNSRFSLHYTGRAVDLSMAPAGGGGQRWWVAKDMVGTDTYWRIHCKTDKQDGSQGAHIARQSLKFYEFYKNAGEKWIPEGDYIDLTAILKSHGMERIPAQPGWEQVAKKQEWWHFYCATAIEPTFSDELELIGYSRAQLKRFGWQETDLDHAPG